MKIFIDNKQLWQIVSVGGILTYPVFSFYKGWNATITNGPCSSEMFLIPQFVPVDRVVLLLTLATGAKLM